MSSTRATGRRPAPAAGAARRSRGPATRRSRTSSPRSGPAADADTRAGSGRRGGSTVTMPRHDRNLPYGRSAAGRDLGGDRTGRLRTRRARRSCGTAARRRRRRARRARCTSPGLGLLERAREQQPGCAVPVLPTVAARSSTTAPSRAPSRFASARTARACRPGDDDPVDLRRASSSAAFSAAFHACSPSGTYFVSPKRSSQTFERRSPGRAPAVEELLGGRAAPRYSAMTGPSASSPTSSAAAPSPPGRLVGARSGRPVRRSAVTTSVGAGPLERDPQRADARAHRAAEVERAARRSRAAARRGSRWRSSCRGTPGRRSRTRAASTARRRAPTAARAGPPRRPSWWCPRRRTRPTGCPCRRRLPNVARDLGPLEAPVRHVARRR